MHLSAIARQASALLRIRAGAATAAITLCVAASLAPSLAEAAPPIRIGVLEDSSGPFAGAGIPKVAAIRLAVDEINAKGGVLGRPLEVVYYDTQSENTRYQEMARRLIQQDKVDVLFGGFTSASREAVRPIVDRSHMLYFYNNEYEGGLCDSNVFVTGPVPEMQFSTALPWMIGKFGKRVYYVGADYNFGQISGQWVRKIVAEHGGTMVGEDYIPLSVNQFGPTIAKIQAAKPDFIVTIMVGANQVGFYEQQASAGLNIPMVSSIAISTSYEHIQFKPPTMKGMHVPANYFDELDTPASQDFKRRFKAKNPGIRYIGQIAVDSYNGTYLYAQAVARAGSTDKAKVRRALEQGPSCVDGPGGRVCIDPRNHHASMPMYLIEVEADHSIRLLQTQSRMNPDWVSTVKGCDLTREDRAQQYTLD